MTDNPSPSDIRQEDVREARHLDFFSENVDAWGAAEWFNRLATAIRQQDAAVVAGDKMVMETCEMVAASSAMRLVRDYEQQVRAALSAQTGEPTREQLFGVLRAARTALKNRDQSEFEVKVLGGIEWAMHGLDGNFASPPPQPDTALIAGGREALAWDANSNRNYEPVELRAQKIYERFDYDGPGPKPAWQPHGNSLKQDQARNSARKLLREAGHMPILASLPQPDTTPSQLSTGEAETLKQIAAFNITPSTGASVAMAMRRIAEEALSQPSILTMGEAGENFLDDPRFDDAAVDFALVQLCKVLGVDPESFSWDAATETFTGDVQAVIGNILRAKYGEDWSSDAALSQPPATEQAPRGIK